MAADRRRSLRQAWQERMETLRQQLADVENTPGLSLLCLLGAATGVLCGLVILAMQGAIQGLQQPLFEFFSVTGGTFMGTSAAFRVAVPLFGALLLGLITEWVIKSSGYGIVHIIERLVYYQGVLPVKAAIAEFTMSALAIASGQSIGREGAAAHIGATTGSWLGGQLALPNNSVRTLVGCGAAAGIAASFNTPLAAVIFAMEVVMMEYTIAGFAPIILAAVTGSLVTFTFTDAHPSLLADYSGFATMELPYLAVVGVVLGIVGAGFTRLCGALVPLLGKIRISLRITLAGLVTGLLAIPFPQIMGLGFETVNASLAGEHVLSVALGIGLAKLLASSFATAAAIPGGVILPTFVIGSSLGSGLGSLGALFLPHHADDSGLYALLGIGAMMGRGTAGAAVGPGRDTRTVRPDRPGAARHAGGDRRTYRVPAHIRIRVAVSAAAATARAGLSQRSDLPVSAPRERYLGHEPSFSYRRTGHGSSRTGTDSGHQHRLAADSLTRASRQSHAPEQCGALSRSGGKRRSRTDRPARDSRQAYRRLCDPRARQPSGGLRHDQPQRNRSADRGTQHLGRAHRHLWRAHPRGHRKHLPALASRRVQGRARPLQCTRLQGRGQLRPACHRSNECCYGSRPFM